MRAHRSDLAYRVYVTDTLRVISENTARLGGGSYMRMRYADMLSPEKEDTRDAGEIIAGIREKLREG